MNLPSPYDLKRTGEYYKGKSFVVTGVYAYSNRRFAPIHTDSYIHAMSINLWKGTVWVVLPNGKRKKIKEVWN
jgi:hypothetical protein